jgi:hypothetical protein
MNNQHKPRTDDHLVEPMYHALHKGEKASMSDWRWKILWVILAVLGLGYVVWRQAF